MLNYGKYYVVLSNNYYVSVFENNVILGYVKLETANVPSLEEIISIADCIITSPIVYEGEEDYDWEYDDWD